MDIDLETDYCMSDVYQEYFEVEVQAPTLNQIYDRDIECVECMDDENYTDGAIQAALATKNMR